MGHEDEVKLTASKCRKKQGHLAQVHAIVKKVPAPQYQKHGAEVISHDEEFLERIQTGLLLQC